MKAKYNISFYYMIFLISALILIPKELGTIFNIIPTRLGLIYFWFIIIFYELITKKIKLNRINTKPLVILYLLFIFTMFFGYFNAIDKILFFYTISKYICYGMLMFFIIKYPFNKKQINFLIDVVLLSAFFLIIYSFLQYFLDLNLNKNGIYKYPGAMGRVDVTFHNPIYFAIFLLGIIFLSFYKMNESVLLKNKIIYVILIFLTTTSIFLTFTRSVYLLIIIVLIIMFILSMFKKGKSKYQLYFSVSPMLFLILLLYMIPGAKYVYSSSLFQLFPGNYCVNFLNFTNKFLFTNIDLNRYVVEPSNQMTKDKKEDNKIVENNKTIENNKIVENNKTIKNNKIVENNKAIKNNKIVEDASLNNRNNFKRTAKMVKKNYPLTGVGMGNYEKFVLANKDKYISDNEKFGYPHNLYLHITAETGYLGLLSFIVLIIYLGIIIFKNIFRKSKYISWVYVIILYINIILLGFYESVLYDIQITPIIIIIGYVIAIDSNIRNVECDKNEIKK